MNCYTIDLREWFGFIQDKDNLAHAYRTWFHPSFFAFEWSFSFFFSQILHSSTLVKFAYMCIRMKKRIHILRFSIITSYSSSIITINSKRQTPTEPCHFHLKSGPHNGNNFQCIHLLHIILSNYYDLVNGFATLLQLWSGTTIMPNAKFSFYTLHDENYWNFTCTKYKDNFIIYK